MLTRVASAPLSVCHRRGETQPRASRINRHSGASTEVPTEVCTVLDPYVSVARHSPRTGRCGPARHECPRLLTRRVSVAANQPSPDEMSSVNTQKAPSFAGGGAGGGGKRGRDGDDGRPPRRPNNSKPVDAFSSAANLGPNGPIRQLVLLLLQVANLGTVPGANLVQAGGAAGPTMKPLGQRVEKVSNWLDAQLRAPECIVRNRDGTSTPLVDQYTELAEAFAHVARAINANGLYDELVAMLVQVFTDRALQDADSDAGDDAP